MQQYPNIQDLPTSSANVPIQQFQLLQQPRSPGFGGYGTTFITPHHSLMYATRDVAFYPSALTASDYNLPYTVQQPEKQVSVSAAEPAVSKPEPAPPPPKAPRTSKKNGDKSGSTYASRHQAAESRRRQRINDRCVGMCRGRVHLNITAVAQMGPRASRHASHMLTPHVVPR